MNAKNLLKKNTAESQIMRKEPHNFAFVIIFVLSLFSILIAAHSVV